MGGGVQGRYGYPLFVEMDRINRQSGFGPLPLRCQAAAFFSWLEVVLDQPIDHRHKLASRAFFWKRIVDELS
jgi:hypothetical protein